MVETPSLPDEMRATLPPAVTAYIAALEAAVTALQQEVTALRAQVSQDSTNSSRPPSSDLPGRRARPSSAPGSRPPGGQRGHRGFFRALRPVAAVDQVVVVRPEACARCGRTLAADVGPADPADLRHQVLELPPVAVTVTEYQLAARTCADCGCVTRAAWPADVPRGVVGPRLAATTGLLAGRYRLSKRETAQCLGDLFGADLAVGSISAVEQQVSAALEPVVAEARTAAQRAAVANLDETGWRQGRRRAWLWTMVTPLLTIFQIDRTRKGEVARSLLGPDWQGVVGSDRFSGYRWLDVTQRQVCWAHLKRDFQKLVDWGPGPRPIGRRLLALEAEVFGWWGRFRAGEVERAELERAVGRLAAEMEAVLAEGAARGHPVAQPLCRDLLTLWPALWSFLLVDGVEPTNNAAEQALRPAVLWRKGSFGTHSDAGSRFAERLLTVSATCRQQRRSLFAFLVAALTAAHCGQPAPSLLPAAS